jgi:hypothetical protein
MEPSMDAKTYTLKAPEDAHLFFRGYRCHPPTGWWFRGQADATWSLVPKAGRAKYSLPDGRGYGRFRSWSQQAVAYYEAIPENDWERLAIAQHFGLATCLLDWTYNPLVALYFACAELPDEAGAVYCYDPDHFLDEKIVDLETANCSGAAFVPRAISQRILSQRAVFSVHLPAGGEIPVKPSAVTPDHPNLAKLIVPAPLKGALIELLNDYGISRVGLFPDLEGLSRHVNWETEQIVKPRQSKG